MGLLAWSQIQKHAKRKLQFQPLPKKPARRQAVVVPQPAPMAQPPNPANLKAKLAKFKGESKKEDPDAHVAQFSTKWKASGLGALYGDDVKK